VDRPSPLPSFFETWTFPDRMESFFPFFFERSHSVFYRSWHGRFFFPLPPVISFLLRRGSAASDIVFMHTVLPFWNYLQRPSTPFPYGRCELWGLPSLVFTEPVRGVFLGGGGGVFFFFFFLTPLRLFLPFSLVLTTIVRGSCLFSLFASLRKIWHSRLPTLSLF